VQEEKVRGRILIEHFSCRREGKTEEESIFTRKKEKSSPSA